MLTKISQTKKINKIVMFLTLSDIFTWGLYLIVNSLVGIYLSKKIDHDATAIIGIGVSIYYATRALSQIPIAYLTDKTKSDRDDIFILTLGNFLMGAPFLFYPFISEPFMYYFLQIIMGLGASMNLVNWRKIFAKNLDKGKEGLEYGIYDTVMSVAMIVFSLTAGLVANINDRYFDIVMITVGLLTISSGIWTTLIYFIDRKS
ncbi:MAG: hypothetical protein KatS3mg085_148 [Candidatus Dojkabacteria bacterium]|nr:MAG: hypothetical protein KatS3mg085_148 [Candidatus Dojkabacteria bacterium]